MKISAPAFLLGLLAWTPGHTQTIWPTHGWTVSTAAAEKMNDIPLLRLDSQISKGVLGYVDHLLIIRNGKQVFEKHYVNDQNTTLSWSLTPGTFLTTNTNLSSGP